MSCLSVSVWDCRMNHFIQSQQRELWTPSPHPSGWFTLHYSVSVCAKILLEDGGNAV